MVLISEYYNSETGRMAKVYQATLVDIGNVPYVEYYSDDKLIASKHFHGVTLRYAEDAAENFVDDIGENDLDLA